MHEKACRNNSIFSKFKFRCSLIIDIRMLTLSKYCHEYIICENVGEESCDVCNASILVAFLSEVKLLAHIVSLASHTENGIKTWEMQRTINIIEKIKERVIEKAFANEQNVTALRELRFVIMTINCSHRIYVNGYMAINTEKAWGNWPPGERVADSFYIT